MIELTITLAVGTIIYFAAKLLYQTAYNRGFDDGMAVSDCIIEEMQSIMLTNNKST